MKIIKGKTLRQHKLQLYKQTLSDHFHTIYNQAIILDYILFSGGSVILRTHFIFHSSCSLVYERLHNKKYMNMKQQAEKHEIHTIFVKMIDYQLVPSFE